MNARDSDYPGIEPEWRAPQAMNQTTTGINWKLIFLLAAFGLLTSILNQQEFARVLPVWFTLLVTWLVMPGSFAGWIVKSVTARYFLHGFLAGLFYNVVAVSGWAIIGYFSNSSAFREISAQTPNAHPATALIIVTVSAAIGSPMLGLYCGLFAWVAGKIVKARGVK